MQIIWLAKKEGTSAKTSLAILRICTSNLPGDIFARGEITRVNVIFLGLFDLRYCMLDL